MKTNQSFVSIVMPVYNAGDFLIEAIKSLQNQTHRNWELIAVDNRSTDNSWQILQEFARDDIRIKIYRHDANQGVAYTANLALTKTRGQFVARMDADDISLPWRLEKQVEFLENNPEVVAVGGQCEVINRHGEIIGQKEFPKEAQLVVMMMFQSIPLQQPAMMVNRKLLPNDFIWYEDNYDVAEEVELLFKLFQYGKVCNLPEVVLQYRLHDKNISLQNPKRTFFLTFKTRLKAIYKYGYKPTLWGVTVTLIQLIAVSLLPSKLIYPVYALIRGMKRIDFTRISPPLLIQAKWANFIKEK